MTSGYEQSLEVRNDSARFYAEVPLDGESGVGELLTGNWRDTCSGALVANGTADVTVLLAVPVAIQVTRREPAVILLVGPFVIDMR